MANLKININVFPAHTFWGKQTNSIHLAESIEISKFVENGKQ